MIRNHTDELVIRTRVPSHWRVIGIVAAVVAAIALAAGGYVFGIERGRADLGRSQEQVRQLNAELARLRARHEEVSGSTVQIQRQLQIDKVAYEELAGQLHRANLDLADLRSELKFYRSIISPADGTAGLRIHNFEIRPGSAANVWRYKLVLIQALNHGKEIRGHVSLQIEGTRAGAANTPATESVRVPDEVKFKYFQALEGEITLPEDFSADAVTVMVKGKKKKDPRVEKRYAWTDVIAAN